MKGYDVYQSSLDLYDLIEYIQKNNITIYHLKQNEKIFFLSTLKYRKLLLKNENIQFQYSIGFIGMLFRLVLSKEKIVAALLSCLLFVGLTHSIFKIEIYGDSILHKELIQKKLNQFKLPFFLVDHQIIYKELVKLNDHLNWYEVVQKGSNLEVYYLPRISEPIVVKNSFDLLAEKEGIIAGFDVLKGNKMVNLNEKVKKGDVLVSHITFDSQNIEKTSEVIGKVYAYTFQKVDVEIKNKNYPSGIGYMICLLKSRMSIELAEEEHIVKEISLHFSEDKDTIRMSNYYVLYEMISIVGD